MARKRTVVYPDWVEKHRAPGVEIRFRQGKYYTLYECGSKYSPEKKRTMKVTGKCLGVIKPDGLVPCGTRQAKKALLKSSATTIHQKEYGASKFITTEMADINQRLEKHFPDFHREIISMALSRLLHQSPLKNMDFHFEQSFLSEMYGNLALGDKKVSEILHYLGENRSKIVDFCREDVRHEEHILMD